MNEVIRLKKVEAKNDLGGDGLSDIGTGLRDNSGGRRMNKFSPQLGTTPKIKLESIQQLEKQCEKMQFEKEDQFMINDMRLKEEDVQMAQLQQQILKMT